MKNLIQKTVIAAAAFLVPALGFAGANIPSGYQGQFIDQATGIQVKLEGAGMFSNSKATFNLGDNVKRQQNLLTLADLASLSKMMADPKKKPATIPPGFYGEVVDQENENLYFVTPTTNAVQQSAEGLVWYEADLVIIKASIHQKDKLASFEATHCSKGLVQIDTRATRIDEAFEIGCPEDEKALLFKRTK